MMGSHHGVQSPARAAGGPAAADDFFDWNKLAAYVLFALGSVRRRSLVFVAVVASIVSLTASALVVLPKTYEVRSRLLAQRNPVLTVRADNQSEVPTRAAPELILDRDNLHALIRQTDLLTEWWKRRAPLLRLKDSIVQRFSGRPSDAKMIESLTGLLEKNLVVWSTSDGTVNIQLHWPDALMAYRLVDAAEQNFLERRHVIEITTISEQLSILEGHAAELKKELDARMAELQQVRSRFAASDTRVPVRLPPARAMAPEMVMLRVELEAKRRAIADLEAFRQRHLLELQTRFADQRATYSDKHPIMVDLQKTIDSLQRESPQVTALREQEADLRQKLGRYADEELPNGTAMNLQDIFRADRDTAAREDPAVEYARDQVRYAALQYALMRDRIASANLDLDTARAAFKYRYNVVVPPEIPRGPIKPRAPLVMIAAALAALLLGIFATTAADLVSGTLVETWQAEEDLGPGIPVVEVRVE